MPVATIANRPPTTAGRQRPEGRRSSRAVNLFLDRYLAARCGCSSGDDRCSPAASFLAAISPSIVRRNRRFPQEITHAPMGEDPFSCGNFRLLARGLP